MTTKTLQEIENNGSEAYWAKQDRDANPHTEGTPESNSWYSGWDQADEENDDDDPTRLCYECDQPIEECQCEDRTPPAPVVPQDKRIIDLGKGLKEDPVETRRPVKTFPHLSPYLHRLGSLPVS